MELIKEYHENGNLKISYKIINDVKEGFCEAYNENGVKKYDLTYKNGQWDGWFNYYNDKGILSSKKLWKNGKYQNHSVEYHDNGNISFETIKIKGVTYCKQYDEMGRIIVEAELKGTKVLKRKTYCYDNLDTIKIAL